MLKVRLAGVMADWLVEWMNSASQDHLRLILMCMLLLPTLCIRKHRWQIYSLFQSAEQTNHRLKKALRFFVKTRRFTEKNPRLPHHSPSGIAAVLFSAVPKGVKVPASFKSCPKDNRSPDYVITIHQEADRPRAGGPDAGGQPGSAGAHRPSAPGRGDRLQTAIGAV